MGLSMFSFQDLWSPMQFFLYAGLVLLYFYVIGPWREKHFPTEERPSRIRQAGFVLAVVMFYLSHGGPLEVLGHMMFSFHMANMSISYLFVPPLVLFTVPAYVWRTMFKAPFWSRLKWLTHPLLCLLLFNLLFSIYHVPVVHDYVMVNFMVHRIYYVALLLTAFLMWWQIVSPVPEWNRLSHVKKMGYIFANGVLLTPACALIIFADTPLYSIYTDPLVWATAMGYCVSGSPEYLLSQVEGPAAFALLHPLEDQQTGGIIMKLVQEIMYGAILSFVFYSWFRKEHKEDDPIPPKAEPSGV